MIDDDDDAHRPLPVVLKPVDDELLSSWLARHAAYYGVSGPFFAKWLMPDTRNLSLLDHRLGLTQVARISEKLRCDPIALIAMTLIDTPAGSAELICRNRAHKFAGPARIGTRARAHPARSRSIGVKLGASPAPLAAHLCPTRTSVPIPAKHCATPAHSRMCGMKLLPARRSSSVSCTALARSTTRRSRSCGRCSCKLGGHAARMAASLRSDGRLARSFPISTILLGLSSAGSTMPPLQLFQSHSVRRSWRVFRGRSPIPQSSMLFGMTRSYAGEGHSSACVRQPVSKLKQRGKATKRENIRARYSHVSWLFRS